jgi:ABC-type nitrate/sulfonate/bicarbonate transport system substrate-binding protein
MADHGTIEINAYYRSSSHLPLWEVIREAGIWSQVGIRLSSFEYCADPPDAEAALFSGKVDLISGDHLTPYGLVAEGKPIVSLASPVNATSAKIVARMPIQSLHNLRGKKIADTPLEGRDGGFHHGRGNHMMYLIRSGIGLKEVQWFESEDSAERYRALQSGRADALFGSGDLQKYEREGFHTLSLDPLPMINGPTLTTSIKILQEKPGLGERLVKAMVLGIHFARTRKAETEKIIEKLSQRTGEDFSAQRLARMPAKPYPDPQAIINAYELGCMKSPEAKKLSPLALWDLHYLRELDDSGFIDRLYKGDGGLG